MKLLHKHRKKIQEGYFNTDSAAADSLRFTDPRDGERKCLMWDEFEAYPFSYYDNQLYIGEESSMHSSPCQKYIQDVVRQDIEENGLDAECNGTFIIDDEEYSLGEYDDSTNEQDRPLLNKVLYNVDYDTEYQTKFCQGLLIWDNDDRDEFNEDWDNLYDALVKYCYDDDDLAWEVYKYIERDAGITNEKLSKEYKIINYYEEPDMENIDLTPYLEAQYNPTNNEINNYIQSSYDSGRYWVYDKIIAMWNGIYANFDNIIHDLTMQTNINFNDFYAVYEDEDTEEIKCEQVSVILNRFNTNLDNNDDNTTHRDTRYDNGFVPHVPSQLDRNNDINDFYRERKKALKGFLADRNNKMNKKLAIHDHDGNTVNVMPMAQYNYLKHPYGENTKHILNKLIKENINKYIINETKPLTNNKNKPITQQNKYTLFITKHLHELPTLLMNFLQNCEEGENLYSPYVKGAQINYTNYDSYLEFHRHMNIMTQNKHDIDLNKSNPLVDLNYLANLIKFFYYCDNTEERNKWTAMFKYNKQGHLRYVLKLIDTLVRDNNGKIIQSNEHPISKKGEQQVNDFNGKYVKSPKGTYIPYNGNENDTKHNDNLWNLYFNPEYAVKNTQKTTIRYDRNKQTGNGQFPIHWFPKYGDNPQRDLSILSQLIMSITGYMTDRGKALFIAFLKCVDSKQLKGYQNFKIKNYGQILHTAEKLIETENPNKYTYSNNRDCKTYYKPDEYGHYRDENGNPCENDMDFMSKTLGIETKKYNKKYLL